MTNTRLTRRGFTQVAAGAAVATPLLAACKGGNKSGEDAKAGDTFTYWSMWKEGEDQQKVLAKAIEAFTAKTQIKVEVQWAGRDVLTQIVPRLNAGNPPDLFDQGAPDVTSKLGLTNVESLDDVYSAEIPDEGKKVSEVVPEPLQKL